VPSGELVVAVVLSVKVKVSPFTAPTAEAENVGFAAPKARLASAAVTVRVALPTVRVPLT
jgi:hypothetical protein